MGIWDRNTLENKNANAPPGRHVWPRVFSCDLNEQIIYNFRYLVLELGTLTRALVGQSLDWNEQSLELFGTNVALFSFVPRKDPCEDDRGHAVGECYASSSPKKFQCL